MRHLSYFLASLLLLSIATSAVWADEEPAEKKTEKPAAEKKAEPEEKAEEEEKAEPEKKPEAKPKAKPAAKPEAKSDAKSDTKPAAKPAAKPDAKPDAKPTTHTVKADMLRIELSLDGLFMAQSMTPVELRPESWTKFKVVKAVAHGEEVKKGDVLVEFETKAIDEAIADQETAQELAALSLKQAELGLKLLEATTPMDLEYVDRQRKMAAEDLKRFLEIDIELSKKSAENSLKSAEQSLEMQLEELNQLEKMYKADDLTEETEEIVLRRQRQAVERSKFYLELAKNRYDESINVYMPRNKLSMLKSADLVKLSLDRMKATLPISLEQERIALEKLKVQQTRDLERFGKLKSDRKLMTITAPANGIVYYGKCTRGKWSSASTVAAKLKPKASASVGPLMMIVSPRPLLVRATVSEKDLHWVNQGMRGTITPTAAPDVRAPATITEMDQIINVDGAFAAVLRVSTTKGMDAVMPGMKCKVKLVPYMKRRTLVIPTKAMKADEVDDTKHYVKLVDDNDRQVKQLVTIGQKKDKIVEILDGLVKGDKILAEYKD